MLIVHGLDLSYFTGKLEGYLRAKGLVTGEEYLASIEFGNEVVSGSGETILYRYDVTVR